MSSWEGSSGHSGVFGSDTPISAVSGVTKGTAAAATSGGDITAEAVASRFGMGLGTTENRKLTVSGGKSYVIVRVVNSVVGGSKNEGTLSSNSVGSPRNWSKEKMLSNFSKLVTIMSSTQPCGAAGLRRIF